MRKAIFSLLILALPLQFLAQNEIDALRYSFIINGGTARFTSMSGAFGALGADFSVLSTNPAGIATFKKNRVMFTPAFIMKTTSSEYKGNSSSEENTFSTVGNFGISFNLKKYKEENTGWNNVGIAFGYNRLRNFYNDIQISGYNENSSLLDQFMLNSDGTLAENLPEPEFLVYDTYLTDYADIPNNTDLLYIHPYFMKYFVNQTKKIKTSGGIGEYVISIGGNYADIFQIGMTLGIQSAKYEENSVYSESSDSTDLEYFDYTEHLSTKGTGYNFKFGMIYRPVDAIRLGIAFHTPTFFKFKDIYSYEVSSDFRTPDIYGDDAYYSASDAEFESNYEIYTPWRTIASVAFVLGQYATISADYEYVDYGKSRLRSEDYDYTNINNNISEIYKSGQNLRLGAEIRLAPVYFRGGVSYYGSPTSKGVEAIGSVKGYSLGIGLQTENVFIDFGFNHSFTDVNYNLYNYGDGIESALLNQNEDLVNFTVGYKF